jgi:hypothetical protein
VTATAGSYNGTYNGSPESPSACIVTATTPPSTFIGTVTCTNNLTSVGPNAGSGTVTPVPAVGAGDSFNNYTIALAPGNWTINQAPVTVNLLNMTNQTYTGGPLSPTVTTMPSGIAVSLTGGGDVSAGSYPVSASVTNPNYSGTASGNFVIGQYPLTVTATGVNKTFDGTTNATVTLSDNRIPGDNSISDSYASAAFASIGPGTGITVNVNGISISGTGMGNYALQNTTATTTANISTSINLANLALNGSVAAAPVVLTGPVLQLTNSGSETSSAWLGTAIPVSSAFTTTFQFQITPASTSANSIGDGFAFVIQGAPTGAATLGLTAYGMYIGYDGIPNSIAIEFDTYQNTGYGDPSSPHIGIQSNGAGANSPDHTSSAKLGGPVTATFANGTLHSATIAYDGSSIISVYLDGSTVPVVSGTVTGGLSSFLGLSGGPAYVGFTAGTGSAQENADILSWNWMWTSAPPSTPAAFATTGSLNTARENPAVTLLQNGQVLVTGGQSSTGSILQSAELYDPTTGTFSTTGPMNAARYVHTATLLPNGQVLITGGQNSSGTLQSAEVYNPATGAFSSTGSMNATRSNHTATLLLNGQVLITGGNNSGPSAELYNPNTGMFTATTGSMGTDRYVANAALLPNGQVLIVGGISSGPNIYQSSAELYDPTMDSFSPTGSMSTPRGYFTATLLQNGKVLTAGGADPTQVPTAQLYDPAAGTFGPTFSMTNVQGGPATLLGDGQVLIAGGYNGGSLATAELYNPGTGTFGLTNSMTTPRNGAAATLLYDGQVLVVGGADGSSVLASAELYSPPN